LIELSIKKITSFCLLKIGAIQVINKQLLNTKKSISVKKVSFFWEKNMSVKRTTSCKAHNIYAEPKKLKFNNLILGPIINT